MTKLLKTEKAHRNEKAQVTYEDLQSQEFQKLTKLHYGVILKIARVEDTLQ